MATKKELIEALEEMLKTLDSLPATAMIQPVTHYDHYSLLLILRSFFLADCESSCSAESCDIKAS